MRISDWSSDVCSSDLPRHHLVLDGGRHELSDIAAEHRDLLDQPARDRLQRDIGHQEHRLDPVVERLVHARHLIFVFEVGDRAQPRSEEHTSELQSLMRISYAVFCLKKKTNTILSQYT